MEEGKNNSFWAPSKGTRIEVALPMPERMKLSLYNL